jgi:TatD DNase family protein
MPWTDSHCHVPYEGLEDVGAVLDAARAAGVARMVSVGTDASQSAAACDVARAHDGVWATVGLHPHDAKDGVETIVPVLDAAVRDGVVVGVGECGLDYHYDHSPRGTQRDAFAAQIALAHERALPLVVHTREAWDDTLSILRADRVPARGVVFHCFTGGADDARACLSLGDAVWLSFSGILTFKRADDVRDAARLCPLDRVLVETDAPYLAPEPHRGRTNAPAFVPLVGAAIAAVQGVPTERVEDATWRNAEIVFGLR